MLNWWRSHLRALFLSLRRLVQQPVGTVLSALVVGIALSLPAAGYLLLDNLATLARGVSGTPEISLFLEDEAGPAQHADIEGRLQAESRVASYRFVSRDEALTQLSGGGLGDVLGGLSRNPLPDAFVVVPRGDDPEVYQQLAEGFRVWPAVEHVQLDSEWVERLYALLELGKFAVLILAVLLGFALVVVTFNTIRLQILTHRKEIEVSRLLGATDPFIRRPFYWFGSLQGLLGGLVALAAVWFVIDALSTPVDDLARTYGAVFELEGPDWQASLVILGFAALLGWLGSAISVRRHLSERLS